MLLTGQTSQESRPYTEPEKHNRADPVNRCAGDLGPSNLRERYYLTPQIPNGGGDKQSFSSRAGPIGWGTGESAMKE